MDFVTHLPITENGCDRITAFVNSFTELCIEFLQKKQILPLLLLSVSSNTFLSFRIYQIPSSKIDIPNSPQDFGTFMKRYGIESMMPWSHHHQMDGATKTMNRVIENYLRCYCAFQQDNWDRLLSSAAFAYYSVHIESLGVFHSSSTWA